MTLHTTDSGAGPKHTLVFIHGFPFNHSMWAAQMACAQPHFRVVAYDQRGHGLSDAGSGQYAFEDFVDDLLEIMDGRQIKQAILCGLSLGGYVALRAIERSPARFNGLILCDTRSEADTNEGKLKRAANAKMIANQGVPSFCENFLKSLFTPETFSIRPTVVDQVRQMMISTSALGMIGTMLAMAGRTDTTESLSRIQVPTLILVGDKDPITPPSAAQAMHERIAGSKLAVIPQASHLSNLENPTAFNRHFTEFLKTYN